MVSFPRVFPPKSCVHLFPTPYVLHTLTIFNMLAVHFCILCTTTLYANGDVSISERSQTVNLVVIVNGLHPIRMCHMISACLLYCAEIRDLFIPFVLKT
jgi:hypothetical protein